MVTETKKKREYNLSRKKNPHHSASPHGPPLDGEYATRGDQYISFKKNQKCISTPGTSS